MSVYIFEEKIDWRNVNDHGPWLIKSHYGLCFRKLVSVSMTWPYWVLPSGTHKMCYFISGISKWKSSHAYSYCWEHFFSMIVLQHLIYILISKYGEYVLSNSPIIFLSIWIIKQVKTNNPATFTFFFVDKNDFDWHALKWHLIQIEESEAEFSHHQYHLFIAVFFSFFFV